jgi:protein-S-isoprenylcysteine O-methyltransferase Ste14
MNTDEALVYGTILIWILLLVAVVKKSRRKNYNIAVHVLTLLAYAPLFYYNMHRGGSGGNSLAWFGLLVCSVAMHIMVLSFILLLRYWASKRNF